MKLGEVLIRIKEDYQSLSAHSDVEPIVLNPLYAHIYPVSRNPRREHWRRLTRKLGIPTTIRQPALRYLCYAYKTLGLITQGASKLRSRLPNQKELWSVENVAFVLACSKQTARSYVRTIKFLNEVEKALLDLDGFERKAQGIERAVNELSLKLEGTTKRAYGERHCSLCWEKGMLTKFIYKSRKHKGNEDVWYCPQCTEIALEMIENRKKRVEG